MPRNTDLSPIERALEPIRDDAAYLRGLSVVARRRVAQRRKAARAPGPDAEAFALLAWALRQIDRTSAHLYAAVKRLQRRLRHARPPLPKS